MQVKLRRDDSEITVDIETDLQLPEVGDVVAYAGCRYKVISREWKYGSHSYVSLVLERIYAC